MGKITKVAVQPSDNILDDQCRSYKRETRGRTVLVLNKNLLDDRKGGIANNYYN